MTFYEQQVHTIRRQQFPHDDQIRRIVRAKHFIDKDLSNEINLGAIADSASLSKFHFLRLFKKYYGRTPHQYRTEQRMIKAKQLLQAQLSTSDVCYLLNFNSVTTFIGLFKKYTGFTPATYQNKMNNENRATLKSPVPCFILTFAPGQSKMLHENQASECAGR